MNTKTLSSIEDRSKAGELAGHIQIVDTVLCSPWDLSNRYLLHVTEESCSDLIVSIREIGQKIPVLLRKNKASNGYELICGVKRLFACKYLGIKLKAVISDMSDKEALLAMDAENRQREDISPYERACDYKRWIESGIYANYKEIIAAIGVKKSWFSQLIALSDLQEDIIAAFGHPANLKQKWGYELQLRCKKDSVIESSMVQLARNLKGKALSSVALYNKLKNVLLDDEINANKATLLISDNHKKELFEVKYSKVGQPRLIFKEIIDDSVIEKIIQATKRIIEEHQV